jgi:hypothetical protein
VAERPLPTRRLVASLAVAATAVAGAALSASAGARAGDLPGAQPGPEADHQPLPLVETGMTSRQVMTAVGQPWPGRHRPAWTP